MKIQKVNFGIAGEKIVKYQEKYRKDYNKRNGTISFKRVYQVGTKVQWRKHKSKNQRGQKTDLLWIPRDGYVVISKIDNKFRKVVLVDSKKENPIPELKNENSEVSWERIRLFHHKIIKQN